MCVCVCVSVLLRGSYMSIMYSSVQSPPMFNTSCCTAGGDGGNDITGGAAGNATQLNAVRSVLFCYMLP